MGTRFCVFCCVASTMRKQSFPCQGHKKWLVKRDLTVAILRRIMCFLRSGVLGGLAYRRSERLAGSLYCPRARTVHAGGPKHEILDIINSPCSGYSQSPGTYTNSMTTGQCKSSPFEEEESDTRCAVRGWDRFSRSWK